MKNRTKKNLYGSLNIPLVDERKRNEKKKYRQHQESVDDHKIHFGIHFKSKLIRDYGSLVVLISYHF